jgi:hypothetical protein
MDSNLNVNEEELSKLALMSSDEIHDMVINMNPDQLLQKKYKAGGNNYNLLYALILRDVGDQYMGFVVNVGGPVCRVHTTRKDTIPMLEAITHVTQTIPQLIDEELLRYCASHHDAAFKLLFHQSRPSPQVSNNVLHESADDYPTPTVIQMLMDGTHLLFTFFLFHVV